MFNEIALRTLSIYKDNRRVHSRGKGVQLSVLQLSLVALNFQSGAVRPEEGGGGEGEWLIHDSPVESHAAK